MPTWVRMRDTKTGHHFDATRKRAGVLAERGAAEPIKDYPVHVGPNARPPKANTSIEPGRRRRRATTTAPAAEPDTSTEEMSHDAAG